MLDWEQLFSNILMVAIPVAIPAIIAAIASRRIVNSWQEKKAEFKLKKSRFELREQIVKGLEDSFYKNLLLLDTFVQKISQEYVTDYFLKTKEGDVGHRVKYEINIPENVNEYPRNKFSKEYSEFKKDLEYTTIRKWKFFATLRIYFNVEKFDKVLVEISDSNHYCEQLVHALMHSKNTKTWVETYSEFRKEFEAYRLLNHRLSHLLTTNKMKDPPDD